NQSQSVFSQPSCTSTAAPSAVAPSKQRSKASTLRNFSWKTGALLRERTADTAAPVSPLDHPNPSPAETCEGTSYSVCGASVSVASGFGDGQDSVEINTRRRNADVNSRAEHQYSRSASRGTAFPCRTRTFGRATTPIGNGNFDHRAGGSGAGGNAQEPVLDVSNQHQHIFRKNSSFASATPPVPYLQGLGAEGGRTPPAPLLLAGGKKVTVRPFKTSYGTSTPAAPSPVAGPY
ncbi:unnamed protein product, partial [Amoebophrya sp. A25]